MIFTSIESLLDYLTSMCITFDEAFNIDIFESEFKNDCFYATIEWLDRGDSFIEIFENKFYFVQLLTIFEDIFSVPDIRKKLFKD